jgi:hypothetical protein
LAIDNIGADSTKVSQHMNAMAERGWKLVSTNWDNDVTLLLFWAKD